MSLWKVVVDGIKEGDKGLVVEKQSLLVEARDMDVARDVALLYAETHAQFGPRWLAFEWRSTEKTRLPYQLPLCPPKAS